MADLFGEFIEEANDVFGLAAKFCAQIWALSGNAGGTGVEVALTGHIAAESDEDRGAEGVLIGTKESCEDDVARWTRGAELHKRWDEEHERLIELVKELQRQAASSPDMASRYRAMANRLALTVSV